MTTHLPFAFPIRVPDDLLVAFGEYTGLHWNDTLEMEPFVCEAMRNYMKPVPAVEERAAAPSETGYQWKQVFLPEGTRLRASFDHKQYFAVVAGTEIQYGEHAISPSCFANLYGSGNRNAWKAVWLRLPGSTEWLLADVCRSARKAAITRLMQGEAPGACQSPPAVHGAPQDVGKQPSKQPSKQQGMQADQSGRMDVPPHRTSAEGALAGPAPRPSARRSQPLPGELPPSSAFGPAHGEGESHKKSSGRSARRKRRAAKHISGNRR